MGKRLYKYFSAEVLPLVFANAGVCSVKCSLPTEYNDPYELFLGVNLTVDTMALAYYAEIIGNLPHYPTTCFSRSPVVTPMWAHYAKNHTGFVVEFDEEKLKSHFKAILIKDVTYKDGPSDSLAEGLEYAFGTRKPRHTAFFQQSVLIHAYFSKYSAWSYEQECRLLDQNDESKAIGSNIILDIPIDCCLSIIAGKNMDNSTMASLEGIALSSSMTPMREIIGRSSGIPFLRDSNQIEYIFDGESIVAARTTCQKCSEPIDDDVDLCPWCSINEGHEEIAARSNPMRILDRYDLLEDYYKGFFNIGKSNKR